jgi:hypothetical protein
LYGLLICLLFASYRRILNRFRSMHIAPSISYSVATISALCSCLSRVTQESLIARYPTCCVWCQATFAPLYIIMAISMWLSSHPKSMIYPFCVCVLTYLLYVVHFATSLEW